MSEEDGVPEECSVCGAVYGHDPDCGNVARVRLARAERLIAGLREDVAELRSLVNQMKVGGQL
jgi:hypothetical protein